jgi:hypothetical protein
MRVPQRDRALLDTVWQNLAMALVGEGLGEPFDALVTGAVMSK